MLPASTPIWIPDGKSGYVEGIVLEDFKPGQPARVQLCKSQTEAVLPPNVSKSIERRVDNTTEDSAPNDLSSLVHLSKASLLEALRLRHEGNKVYTSVGPILVSVNPYKPIPELYTREKQQEYFEFKTSDPHVYETAARAFLGATKNKQDQSVIFSGESGAGKTHATRLFTEFLVYASSRSENRSEERAVVQQKLTGAMPMIEAFGNAKTSRNDNSSRFGCWTEIEFSGNEICGASVVGFNLEKSRVVTRGEDQRNFHIFYQLWASNPALASRKFNYLGSTTYTEDDKAHFKLTLKSMEELGVDADRVLQMIEAILELGNVEFRAVEDPVTKEENSEFANEAPLERACELFGMDYEEVSKALLIRDMSNPLEQIYKPHSKAQAEEARDALAKHAYGRLFDWLLVKVNEGTSSKRRNGGFNSASKSTSPNAQGIVGLLDTYGFEVFGTNSFEQLCINYCNERIMSAFNDRCIKAEHELYDAEGLSAVTTGKLNEPFQDRSRVCLSLLEANPGGVFSLLDDEIRIPKGNDQQYLRKLRDAQKGHSNFVPYVSGFKDANAKHLFGIVHFAGTVHYSVEDFLDKNRDTLHGQLERLACESAGFMSEALFAPDLYSLSSSPKKTPSKGKKLAKSNSTLAHQKLSLGNRFRLQLDQLMAKISQTETHFVRCIKPNERSCSTFQGSVVLEQLAYGGVLETCRLRKDGFQVRRPHADFLQTYGWLAKSARTPEELAKELQAKYGVAVQIGKTTAFLKAEDFNRLEKALVEQVNDARITIQSFGRLVLESRKHSKRKQFLDKLDRALKKLDEAALDALLSGKEMSEAFPKGAEHVPLIRNAKQTSQWLKEEHQVCEELQTAMKASSKVIPDLQLAIQHAEQLQHDLTGKVVRQVLEAREVLKVWLAEDAIVKAQLREKDREAKASSALLTIQRAVKQYLFAKRVKAAFAQLRDAMSTKNMDACMRAVRRLSDLGLGMHPEVVAAAKMLPALPERKKKATKNTDRVMAELHEAVQVARFKSTRIRQLKPEDVAALTYAINAARVEGVSDGQLVDAIDLEREMLLAVASKKKGKWWWCCGTCGGAVMATNSANSSALNKRPKEFA